jgi:predicted MFS family arabinose efflux permease
VALALALAAACLEVTCALQPLRSRLDGDRDRAHRPGRDLAGPLRLVLNNPDMRRLAFLAGAFSAVQMSFIAYLVTFLVEVVRLDLVAAGVVLAVAQVAGMAGRVLWGSVSGTLITARWLLCGLGLAMAGAALMIASFAPETPHWQIYGVALIFGGTAIGWNGVMLAELARIAPPGKAGMATGGSIFITFAGVVISPALFSVLLVTGLGYAAGFWMLAGIALIGAGLEFRHRVA